MIKATIQRSPYVTEMTFPCSETQLSKWLDELRMCEQEGYNETVV